MTFAPAASNRIFRSLVALSVVALVATGGIAQRAHEAADPGAPSHLTANLSWAELAGRSIFTNLQKKQTKLVKEHRRQCREGPVRVTELPSQIQWATSIHDAI